MTLWLFENSQKKPETPDQRRLRFSSTLAIFPGKRGLVTPVVGVARVGMEYIAAIAGAGIGERAIGLLTDP